ncbi:MAG: FAD-binding protein [Cucumibacter sp.]
MPALLIAEHDNATLDLQTARAVTAALAIAGEVHVLIAGHGCGAVAAAAARLSGISRVLVADATPLADQLAEPVATLVVGLAGPYGALIAAATSCGKNLMPRVAALLDMMQISDIIAVDGPHVFRRTIYAGNAIETVQSTDAKQIVTIRTSAFPPVDGQGNAEVVPVAVAIAAGPVRFIENRSARSDRPELSAARVVVSGGRAFGSKEKFDALLGPLAAKLNAAIGASRAAVDAGYAPNELQVGQTGKVVAPDLYIACGISGAVQHLAGMKGAKIVVAINSDASAPIFQVADYGLVGDVFEILPELARLL